MPTALRTRLTFANVCSFLALLIALGTGSAYAANTVFSADIVDGEVKAQDLANKVITTSKIRDGGVKTPDLGAEAVDGSKVLDESLTNTDLGTDSVQATEVANDSIDSGEIAADSLLASDLADASVGASEITNGTVGNADLASSAVTGSKVATNSLTTSDLAGTDVNGAISLGAGSVANSRCKTYGISVPGAEPGQGVTIATKAALQAGIVIYGQRVSSANTVDMVVCNISGTTMAGFDSLPIRTITFG